MNGCIATTYSVFHDCYFVIIRANVTALRMDISDRNYANTTTVLGNVATNWGNDSTINNSNCTLNFGIAVT